MCGVVVVAEVGACRARIVSADKVSILADVLRQARVGGEDGLHIAVGRGIVAHINVGIVEGTCVAATVTADIHLLVARIVTRALGEESVSPLPNMAERIFDRKPLPAQR